MKQRFLNQKLGKRTSRKAELQKARVSAAKAAPHGKFTGPNPPPGKPG